MSATSPARLSAEIREVEIDRDVPDPYIGYVAQCWTEYAVVVNGYQEDRYPEREEAESLLAAFLDGREQPTLPETWTEEVRAIRPGATLIQWTNPRTTDVIGALYGPREERKTADEARALLVKDAKETSDCRSGESAALPRDTSVQPPRPVRNPSAA
jgi:hypothetical protein